MHECRLITFDVYTALFDVEGSLTPAVGELVNDPLEFVRAWRGKQLELALISNSLDRGRVSFETLTRRALDYVLARAKLNAPEITRQNLVKAWGELQPWPEAGEVLAAVKVRGYLMALLSNGDEAQLQTLTTRLSISFDHIFSSERAGYYKPHPSVYELPCRALGLLPEQILHVAGSATDVLGAKSAGLRCAWSNRRGEPVLDPAFAPGYEFADLRGLLTYL
ncbi:MAG: haloacid dehalogenase type II [Anaerolineales bacterium]